MMSKRPGDVKRPPSLVRILNGLFPRTPDFHQLLNDQCELVVQGMEVFAEYMMTGDQAAADRVRQLEHEGDSLKARNIDILNRSFATPYDREDIYRAITAIDDGLNYAKTSVWEMDVLGVSPDKPMAEMADLLLQGARSLQRGFSVLKTNPGEAERAANAVRKTERHVEKVYRRAIAELFSPQHYANDLAARRKDLSEDLRPLLEPDDKASCDSVLKGVSFVMETLKRREIYRHLSNAADHFAHAGDILHDITVKSA
ncbi:MULTISPECIES: DUF47 domain-containing protein [Hyphomonas]|nr:DUF47 family protein [Hyphomonas sp.]|tara:strand:- start:432 stop:1202 length:771 start_codon:yes stop_codon:yes gene_type:complete